MSNQTDIRAQGRTLTQSQTGGITPAPVWYEDRTARHFERANLVSNADIVIVGAGFVGLWTAILTKQAAPKRDVLVLEMNRCGSGASGRNGGLALSWCSKVPSFQKAVGDAETVRLVRASAAAVSELASFDCEFVRGGFLWTATNKAQSGAWDSTVHASRALGLDAFEELDPSELAARTGSERHLAGVFEPAAATVHPAKLIDALLELAVGLGVKTGGEAISDSALRVHYYRTASDGRVVFGKGGNAIALGGRIGRRFEFDSGRITDTAASFRSTYPTLADATIEYGWSGPIDRPAAGLPLIGRLGGHRNILHAVGWSGNGVAPAHLGGSFMRSLVLEHDDQWTRSPLLPLPTLSTGTDPLRRRLHRARSGHPQRARRAARPEAWTPRRCPLAARSGIVRLGREGIPR